MQKLCASLQLFTIICLLLYMMSDIGCLLIFLGDVPKEDGPLLILTEYTVGDEEFGFAIQANFGRSAVPASRSRYLMAPNNSV